MSEPRPPARILSTEQTPTPPPTRDRRAEVLAPPDDGGTSVRRSAIIHIIGGANGDEDGARPSLLPAIGGVNGDAVAPGGGTRGDDDGDEITAVGGIRIIGARDDDDRPGGH